MALRASCTIAPAVLVQALRAHIPSLEDKAYAAERLEDVVASYQTFLLSLASGTDRLNPSALASAACEVFGGDPSRARHFAQRVSEAFGLCRKKTKTMTTGTKLPPAMRAVCMAMAGRAVTPKKASPKASSESVPGSMGAASSSMSAASAGSSQSPESAPAPKKGKASLSAADEILAFYGVKKNDRPEGPSKAVEVWSSQEICDSQDPLIESSQETQQPSLPIFPSPSVGPQTLEQKRNDIKDFSFVDYASMQMVRITQQGRQEAPLLAGPGAFAVARFGDLEIETEVPNLLVELSSGAKAVEGKKPPRRLKRKTPEALAAADAPEPSPAGGENAPGSSTDTKDPEPGSDERPRMYGKMYYKAGNLYGIRQKFGQKKQIFALGGKTCGLTAAELSEIADAALGMLHEGRAEEEAKKWARLEVGRRGAA